MSSSKNCVSAHSRPDITSHILTERHVAALGDGLEETDVPAVQRSPVAVIASLLPELGGLALEEHRNVCLWDELQKLVRFVKNMR